MALNDTVIAAETCEELFTADSPHINLGLDGVEVRAQTVWIQNIMQLN